MKANKAFNLLIDTTGVIIDLKDYIIAMAIFKTSRQSIKKAGYEFRTIG